LRPRGEWVSFERLREIAEEAMLEQRYAVETDTHLTREKIEKFFRAFDPEVVHNTLQLLESFAKLLTEYRSSHIGCELVNGEDNRCAICRKLEAGSFGDGSLVNVYRVEDKDGK
jgi:glutamyl-tRNA reductase